MALSDLPRRARGAFSLSPPSWATPWRAKPAADAGRRGPRIAVLGNCQARGVAQAMRLLAPNSPVRFLPMGTLGRDHGDIDGLVSTLAASDHVFSQLFPAGLLPGGDIAVLRRRDPRTKLFPTIVFSAFHPDMVYAGRVEDLAALKLARSPLGQYHSAIALCAHRLGLTATQAGRLFREDVFRRLGYLDQWEPAVRELIGGGATVAFGLEREMSRWSRRGAFMHVINHPKVFVVADIARRLLVESGFAPEPVEIEDYLGDELARDVVWPVYPPIAEIYGLTGSYLFKTKPRGDAFPVLYDLPGFLAASFALYDAAEPSDLACARVEAWIGAPEIVAMFRAEAA
ncbi:WcbI family polysaccharide biosynthesis putative acetyltransferase [Methylobacterium sp. J-059]|uniref:WcbI family polysaccharide biosynthesis putative acetyltransferase n=1 Tax=Methylobacterium sp. J-059 TaxID=2836643 RepID=UPI001FBC1022|nr:WcbI family polysaccharide biosynthesis putative acetyltransferase [Methylobacterium sp. J-059]